MVNLVEKKVSHNEKDKKYSKNNINIVIKDGQVFSRLLVGLMERLSKLPL